MNLIGEHTDHNGDMCSSNVLL
ncbi:MAG: galactokinase family protein [Streptococcus salivarius]